MTAHILSNTVLDDVVSLKEEILVAEDAFLSMYQDAQVYEDMRIELKALDEAHKKAKTALNTFEKKLAEEANMLDIQETIQGYKDAIAIAVDNDPVHAQAKVFMQKYDDIVAKARRPLLHDIDVAYNALRAYKQHMAHQDKKYLDAWKRIKKD